MALQKKDVWADRWFWAPAVSYTHLNTPRIIYGDFRNSRDADRFLENGSYFRMKNISIGYNFKQKWLTNLRCV